jgi:leucyl-tRNA synthetase
VEKKSLSQRHIKITDFAEDLYDKLDDLDWSNITKKTQKNWIKKQSIHKIILNS